MAQTKEDNELEILEKEVKNFRTTFKTTCYGASIEQTLGLKNQWLEFISKLTDKWSKRLIEGDLMINRLQEYTDELHQKEKTIEEKQENLLEVLAGIKDKEEQSADLMDSIQKLKEKLIKKGEITSKATEEKMERIGKVEKIFRERIGLEIRKTSANHLQFIFRCIDQKDPDKPYVLTLSINEEGAYEVISCSPPLDCIEELQLKVRETNNFSAFIANIRKAFLAVLHK